MPRFFFNHRNKAGENEVDIDGLKLPSLNNALEEAAFAAEGAVALSQSPTEGVFEIEDEGRVLLASVPYASPAAPDEEAPDAPKVDGANQD
jgi:hypothetical protein